MVELAGPPWVNTNIDENSCMPEFMLKIAMNARGTANRRQINGEDPAQAAAARR